MTVKTKTQHAVQENDQPDIAKMFKNLEKILPDALLQELRSMGDFLEQLSWKSGWLTEEVYQRAKQAGLDYDIMTVCWLVSTGYLRGHLTANSLKAYLVTTRFFSQPVAKAYHYDVLPMSVFTLARSLHGKDSPKLKRSLTWAEILAWAWEQYQDSGSGRCPSNRKIMDEFWNVSPKGTPARSVPSNLGEMMDNYADPETATLDPFSIAGDGEISEEAVLNGFMAAVDNLAPYVTLIERVFPKASSWLASIILQLKQFGQEAMSRNSNNP